MKELEISKALALAIGWSLGNMLPSKNSADFRQCWVWAGHTWKVFDYRDPAVIWPIAAKFNAFPVLFDGRPLSWYSNVWNGTTLREEWAATPEKAVALAVINRTKS